MTYSNYYINLGWILSVIFIIRAIGDFNFLGFFKKRKNTPFAIYDTIYFSPLCLVFGVIFSILTYNAG